jgi:hypothetical protein
MGVLLLLAQTARVCLIDLYHPAQFMYEKVKKIFFLFGSVNYTNIFKMKFAHLINHSTSESESRGTSKLVEPHQPPSCGCIQPNTSM